ncbi:uncharacterized protein VTP21DRAFT_4 [Calcarisporiella thermophila]|uniref:uncharacterized protein n=1 Tax=Calcarisporiella thermophila TaxID=911321 RepID=UPI0037441F97
MNMYNYILIISLICLSQLFGATAKPTADAASYARLKQSLIKSLDLSPFFAASWLRIGFHDAVTYNPADGTGGPDGSMRFSQEYNGNPKNRALIPAILALNTLKETQFPTISYADVFSLASAVAVEKSNPNIKITWRPGRVDCPDFNSCGGAGVASRLPNPELSTMKELMQDAGARLGFNDMEWALLIVGGHSIGGAPTELRVFQPPQDSAKLSGPKWINNTITLNFKPATPRRSTIFKTMYTADPVPPNLIRFTSDMALIRDENIKKTLITYNDAKFETEFGNLMTRLLEVGVKSEDLGEPL